MRDHKQMFIVKGRSVTTSRIADMVSMVDGGSIPYICEMEATALRLCDRVCDNTKAVHNREADATISAVTCIKFGDTWFIPVDYIDIVPPTEGDIYRQTKLEEGRALSVKKKEITQKAIAAGFTMDDIRILEMRIEDTLY